MLGVGTYEISLVIFLMIFLWNKKDFAKILFYIGFWYKKLQNFWHDLNTDLKQHVNEIELDHFARDAQKKANEKQPIKKETKE
ncbi:MAG: hypothetical protein CMM87_06365 [Rickettsiales bacterium]|nr:hypothetical protein [Rickettsiales bacterium]|tara:strand:+ start:43606 stop:43854 length:249 start_codon:yes stop_codon:yes gene_type:complete